MPEIPLFYFSDKIIQIDHPIKGDNSLNNPTPNCAMEDTAAADVLCVVHNGPTFNGERLVLLLLRLEAWPSNDGITCQPLRRKPHDDIVIMVRRRQL